MAEQPSVPELSHLTPPLLSRPFTLTDLSEARRDVEAASRLSGMRDDEVEDWVAAVNELMINAIRHAGGHGIVRMRRDGRLTCEVTDRGAGFDIARFVGRVERPQLSQSGGMGLWMVTQMTDVLHADSGPTGTTICIAVRTTGPPT